MDIYCDGACEPVNPGGWACWAWVALDDDGHEIASDYGTVGHGVGMTNNVAEYHALLHALEWVQKKTTVPGSQITFRMDSQLVVRQVVGMYACRAELLRPLYERTRPQLEGLGARLVWIPREENTRADALSKRAYQEARRGAW